MEIYHLWLPKDLQTSPILTVLHIVDPHLCQVESKICISQDSFLLAYRLLTSFHQTYTKGDLEGRFENHEATEFF